MKKIVFIAFFLDIFLVSTFITGCQREQKGQENQLQATIPSIEPTPNLPGFFTTTATTPNGEFLLNCWYEGSLTCSLQYPNGNQVPYGIGSDGSGIWWSYDNKYAVICNGMTHDSPGCLRGFWMWQMVNGERVEFRIPDFGRGFPADYEPGVEYQWTQFTVFKWKQDENLLAYFYQPDYLDRLGDLVIFDVETGVEWFEKGCPDWLFFPTHETGESVPNLNWTAVCNIVKERN